MYDAQTGTLKYFGFPLSLIIPPVVHHRRPGHMNAKSFNLDKYSISTGLNTAVWFCPFVFHEFSERIAEWISEKLFYR
jgi:hypothetical protein